MNAKPADAETGGAPNLWFDIIREARRGRTTLVRVLYIVALFLILLIPYYTTERRVEPGRIFAVRMQLDETLNYRARLATNFTVTILLTQWLAALVLMPIYAVSSLHADRDNGTLELLLMTPVNGPQIMNAKMWACCVNVGGVLLAGLPLIALIQIWGGVDLLLVVQNVVTTSAAMLAVCALSFHIALRSTRSMLAIGRTYAISTFGHVAFGVFPFLVCAGQNTLGSSIAEQLNCIGLLGGFYIATWIYFQPRNGRFLELLRADMPTFHAPEPADPADIPYLAKSKPEIGDNALIWKERLSAGRTVSLLSALYGMALGFTAMLCITEFVLMRSRSLREAELFNHDAFSMLLAVLLAGVVIIASHLAYRFAGCIVRERETQTLDALLLLPCSRSDILIAKFVGIVTSETPRMVPVFIAWALLWIFAPFQPIASYCFVLAIIVQLFFFAALGLYLSVVCRSSVQATVTLIVVSLTLLTVPIAIPFVAGIEPGRWLAFHPLTSLFILGKCWWSNDLARMAEFLWPQAIYLFVGAMLTVVSWRRFCVR